MPKNKAGKKGKGRKGSGGASANDSKNRIRFTVNLEGSETLPPPISVVPVVLPTVATLMPEQLIQQQGDLSACYTALPGDTAKKDSIPLDGFAVGEPHHTTGLEGAIARAKESEELPVRISKNKPFELINLLFNPADIDKQATYIKALVDFLPNLERGKRKQAERKLLQISRVNSTNTAIYDEFIRKYNTIKIALEKQEASPEVIAVRKAARAALRKELGIKNSEQIKEEENRNIYAHIKDSPKQITLYTDNKNFDAKILLKIASQEGNIQLARLLLSMGASITDQHLHAAYHGYDDILQLLLNAGADLNVTMPDGRGLMSMAFIGLNADCVRVIQEHNKGLSTSEDGEEKTSTEDITVDEAIANNVEILKTLMKEYLTGEKRDIATGEIVMGKDHTKAIAAILLSPGMENFPIRTAARKLIDSVVLQIDGFQAIKSQRYKRLSLIEMHLLAGKHERNPCESREYIDTRVAKNPSVPVNIFCALITQGSDVVENTVLEELAGIILDNYIADLSIIDVKFESIFDMEVTAIETAAELGNLALVRAICERYPEQIHNIRHIEDLIVAARDIGNNDLADYLETKKAEIPKPPSSPSTATTAEYGSVAASATRKALVAVVPDYVSIGCKRRHAITHAERLTAMTEEERQVEISGGMFL